MNTVGLMFSIFGAATLCLASAKALQLRHYETGTYSESWPMWEEWFTTARKEGWLRRGRTSNIRAAVFGGILLLVGLALWRFEIPSTGGLLAIGIIAVISIALGALFKLVQDHYSVHASVMLVAGSVGLLAVLVLNALTSS